MTLKPAEYVSLRSHRSRLAPRAFLFSVLLGSAGTLGLLTGCGMGTTAGPVASTAAVGMSGTVYGGATPIINATISLVAAGTTGYGSAPQVLSTTTTNILGGFTLPAHVCPAPDSLVYVQATSGNSGANTANPLIHLVAVTGNCSAANAGVSVKVNEATTIAAAYVLAPFATVSASGTGIGTSATNILGLNNAFGTANNLVNFTNGNPRAANEIVGITSPAAQMATLANILAACVNSTGSTSNGCQTLVQYTTIGGVAPIDTFQAALNIAKNPANQAPNLYRLVAGTSAPFAGGLTATPYDFTMALGYTAGYGSNGIAIYGSTNVAIDATGNAWVTIGYLSNTLGSLIEISPAGAYLSGSTGFGTSTTLTSPATVGPIQVPIGVAIDPSGSVWVENPNAPNVLKFNANGTLAATIATPSIVDPNGIGIDGSGNVWLTNGGNNYKTVTEIQANGTEAAHSPFTAGFAFGTGVCISQSAVWTIGAGVNGGNAGISRIDLASGNVTSFPVDGGAGNISGCDMDHNNILWVPDITNNFNGAETFNNAGTLTNTLYASEYVLPQELVIDGLGNAFSGTFVYNSGALPFPSGGTLVEWNNAGTLISPSVGYVGASGIIPVIVTDPGGMAIDPSGNIWMAGSQNGKFATNYVAEVIGLAAPVVTPKSLAVKNNTKGVRP